jgi:hypothetical protein
MVPRPALSTSPGKLLEMEIIWPHPRHTESETLGIVDKKSVLESPPGNSDTHSSWRIKIHKYHTRWPSNF